MAIRSIIYITLILFPLFSVFSQTRQQKDSIEWAQLKARTEDYVQNYNDSLDKALLFAKKTKEKAAVVFGKQSKNYGLSLDYFADVYYGLQQYPKAKLYADSAVIILKETVGVNDSDYADALNASAAAQEQLGDYEKVEKVYRQALEIRKKIFTEHSSSYVQSLNNLGEFYITTEDFASAERYLKEAVDMQEKLSGRNYDYAVNLINLAYLYLKKNDYSTAEPLFRQVISIMDTTRDTSEGEMDPYYGDVLNSLASLYTSMNNYSAAENNHRAVLKLIQQVFKHKTPDYGTTSVRLAKLYIETGEYDSANALLQDAFEVYKKELDSSDNPLYAELFDEFAHLYFAKGDMKNAEIYFRKAQYVKEKNSGTNTPSYATGLNNLGLVATKAGRYEEAKLYLGQAARIQKEKMGPDDPGYTESINNILGVYYAIRDAAGWQQHASSAINGWKNSVTHLLLSFGENEKENYLDNHLKARDAFLSMLYYFHQHKNNDNLTSVYFNLVTAMQGWILSGSQQLNAAIVHGHDSSLLRLYNKWIFEKQQYSSAMQLDEATQKKLKLNTEAMLLQIEQTEMDIINGLPTLKTSLQNAGFLPGDVSKMLNAHEAVVNWVSFKYLSPEKWTDSILYCAFVVLHGDITAHFVSFCEQSELQKLLSNYHNYDGRGLPRPAAESIAPKNIDSALYDLLWKPLLGYLNDTKKVYIVPAGLINKVALQSLVDQQGVPLLEKNELHILSGINDLAKKNENIAAPNNTITLFGGAFFYGKNDTVANLEDEWEYLPGTASEVKQVAGLFNESKWQVQLNTGLAASERNFLELSGNNSPDILHIATHGFYIEDTVSKSVLQRAKALPLLRNGFLLTNGGACWGNDTIAKNDEDGIITAEKVANMNLTGTNLVTLSSCESALGDVNNNEGVYGLQRAFKIAGVKNMLVTLWQISDSQTGELMDLFYKGVLKGESYYNALRDAQIQVRKSSPDPAIWAGFELMGQ